ncbi:hypothetical protein OHA21_20390 [Actinoplanes sp. NBC_00393]|uniref:hypothetical protein n=1 Tax=Actinoplanes sp. NBC_00393 TaxID=2975953 RepID=UPI002E1DD042
MLKMIRTAAVLSVATAMIAGCAGNQPSAPAAQPAPVVEQAAKHSGTGFYDALRPAESALLVPQPESLAAAYGQATATIEAEVIGVRPGRPIHDLQQIVVELKPTQVLRGALRPELKGRVEVEFPVAFVPEPIAPIVEKMKADMPEGRGVWLLRWQGAPPPAAKPRAVKSSALDPAFYSVVHPNCGVFVENEGGVESVAAQHEGGEEPIAAQAEGQRFGKLKDLVAHARKK